jgi:hypothetical protein
MRPGDIGRSGMERVWMWVRQREREREEGVHLVVGGDGALSDYLFVYPRHQSVYLPLP